MVNPSASQRIPNRVNTVATGGFAFRHRFRIARRGDTNFEQSEYVLHEDVDSVVWLTEWHGRALSDSEWWVLWGTRFASATLAAENGRHWIERLERAFAVVRQGADFGYRDVRASPPTLAMERLAEQSGQAVLHDEHGLMVVPVGSSFGLYGGKSRAWAVYAPEHFIRAARSDLNRPVHAQQSAAFELFSSSRFAKSLEASFMLKMMAIEALMDRRERRQEVRNYIEAAIELLDQADLTTDERENIRGGISRLISESSHEQGRRLAREVLGTQRYRRLTAEEFFTKCYRLRGRLAHPSPRKRHTEAELVHWDGMLTAFVGDLIAGLGLALDARREPGA